MGIPRLASEVTGQTRAGVYSFGFQGQEHDDELNGASGTSYAFEYRMHDSRVGRFLSIDPLAANYPWNSPYAFAENKVIQFVELEGLETGPPKSAATPTSPVLKQPTDKVTQWLSDVQYYAANKPGFGDDGGPFDYDISRYYNNKELNHFNFTATYKLGSQQGASKWAKDINDRVTRMNNVTNTALGLIIPGSAAVKTVVGVAFGGWGPELFEKLPIDPRAGDTYVFNQAFSVQGSTDGTWRVEITSTVTALDKEGKVVGSVSGSETLEFGSSEGEVKMMRTLVGAADICTEECVP